MLIIVHKNMYESTCHSWIP